MNTSHGPITFVLFLMTMGLAISALIAAHLMTQFDTRLEKVEACMENVDFRVISCNQN